MIHIIITYAHMIHITITYAHMIHINTLGFLKAASHWLLLIPIFSCHNKGAVNHYDGSCDHILPIGEVLSHLLASKSVDISKVCPSVSLSMVVMLIFQIKGVVAKQQLEGCLVVHASKVSCNFIITVVTMEIVSHLFTSGEDWKGRDQ